MHIVGKISIVRLFVPFLLGLIVPWLGWTLPLSLVVWAFFVLFLYAFASPRFPSTWNIRWMPGASFFVLWFVLGFCSMHQARNQNAFVPTDAPFHAMVEVVDEPQSKNNKLSLVVRIEYTDSVVSEWMGKKLLLYAKSDSDLVVPQMGDVFFVSLKPIQPKPASNPVDFDQEKWLHSKGISALAYVTLKDPPVKHKQTWFHLKSTSVRLRNQLVGRFEKAGLHEQNLAFVSALALGARSSMDAAIVQGFSTTGISHILSVSGLHVAIIYGALSFLLSLFDRCNRFHVFRSVFLILFLIFYAFLTGLTPSVCRSAFMLSIHAFGKSIRRHPFGLNTVLISALVLLMYQPLYVLDLGFQLSYLSVFSLIAIFPKLGEWIQPKSVVVKKVWEMSGISIVAQLATAPLTMSVFHTFPNYFLLNNFFAVPASSLLLYLSGGVLLLQDVPWIGVVLSKCLSWGSALFLESTVHSASLPGALTSGLYFNVAEVLSMYLIICCLCFLLYTQKRCWMVYALLGVLLFQCLFWFHLTGF